MRNCLNRKGLSDEARILTGGFDKNIAEELNEKGAKLVRGLGDYRLFECPLSFVTSDTWDILSLVYLIEDSKHLLNDGGWGNQPHWLVEAYRIFKRERARNGNTGTENNNNG
jgi:hypothetical protein